MQKDDQVRSADNDDKGQLNPFSPVGAFAEKPRAYDVGNIFPTSPIQVQNWRTWMLTLTEKTIAKEKGAMRRLGKRLSIQPSNESSFGYGYSRRHATIEIKRIESHAIFLMSIMDSEIESLIQFREVSLKSRDPVDEKLIEEFARDRDEARNDSIPNWSSGLTKSLKYLEDVLGRAIYNFAHSHNTLRTWILTLEGSEAGSLPMISALNDVMKELAQRVSRTEALKTAFKEFREQLPM